MKYLKSNIGMIIAVAAMIWPLFAVWLSAHQFMPVYREGQGLCFLGALFGSMYHRCKIVSRSPNIKNVLLAIAIPVCSVVILYNEAMHSSQMFAYWKLKSISSDEWQQMALDISQVARQADDTYRHWIPTKDLPKSFDALGSIADLHHAEYVKWDASVVAVRVVYGGRGRAWGLLAAPDDYLTTGPWSKYKRTRVATNAYFYVGHED